MEAHIDAIYSSPLQRAMETARSIGSRIGMEPVLLDDLMEVDLGAATGMQRDEARQRWPRQGPHRDDPERRWPGGESLNDLAERAARVTDAIIALHPTGTVVVVSHKVTLRSILAYLMSPGARPDPDYAVDHCAITEVVLGGGRPILACANDRSHLAALDQAGQEPA